MSKNVFKCKEKKKMKFQNQNFFFLTTYLQIYGTQVYEQKIHKISYVKTLMAFVRFQSPFKFLADP